MAPAVPPGAAPAQRTARQRRPTGAPPPLPHPFTSAPRRGSSSRSSIVAGAFLFSEHTAVAPARRPGQHLVPAPARGGADALADRCRRRDQGGRLRLGGHGDRAVGGGADHDLPALAAPAGLPGQPVLPGDRRPVDLLRPVPAAARTAITIIGSWGGYSAPSPPVAVLTIFLMGAVYCLVVPGRPRTYAKIAVAVVVAAVLPGPPVPGRRSPRRRALRRRARGRDPGHGVPLLHPERGVPGRLPPGPDRSRRRDRPAWRGDPDGRARPARADRARDQAGRPGIVGRLDAAAAARRGGPGRVPVRASCTPRATSAPIAGTSSGGPSSTAPWRTRLPSRPCGAWPSTRTTRCGSCGTSGSARRGRTESWRSRPSASTCSSPSSSSARSRSARPTSTTSVIDQGLLLIRKLWDAGHRAPGHQAGQPDGPRRGAAADRRGLRPGAPVAVAAGGRPRQHDAGARRPHRPGTGLPAGAAATSLRTSSPRRSPPPAGWRARPSCARS